MSDSNTSEEEQSGTGTEEEGSDEKSGSGSGSDEDGSGSGDEESGSGSDSDEGSGSGSGSGSGEASDEDGSEGSESEEEEESSKSKKKKKKFEEQKVEFIPTKFQSLMGALRNINDELDGAAKAVDALDSKVARNRPSRGGRIDAKGLLSEIDRELRKGGGTGNYEDQDAKRPRNYHPPESPVRRVFEDGVEVGSGYAPANTGKFVGMPGYTQSLYPPAQFAQGGGPDPWQSAPRMAQSAHGGSAFGHAGYATQAPPQTAMSRFANTRGSPYGPRAGQLAPRTYTDFYRAQSYLQSQSAATMHQPIPPGMGGAYSMPQGAAYPRAGSNPAAYQQAPQAHLGGTAPAGFMAPPQQRHFMAGGGSVRTGRVGSPGRERAGLASAIQTLLK